MSIIYEWTYKLGVSVDPAEGHDTVGDLCFEKFKLSIISHATHVLLAGLGRYYQRINQELAVFLNTGQDGTCFNFSLRVRVW